MNQLEFTEEELKAIRSEYCRGFTDEQFKVAMTFCRVRNLLPGKHVIPMLRKSHDWDETVGAKVENQKIVFITTIDAARLIAQRSGEYTGQGPEQYIYLDDAGNPSIVSEIPLPNPQNKQLPREPWAVRTTVYRKSFDHPVTSVARFDAYAVTRKLKSGELVLTEMWSRRSVEMLAKCSEMLSLRKGYPEELASIYIADELKNESEDAPVTPASVTASIVSLPASAPAVNQTPATPTDTPRPNETKAEFHVPHVPAKLPEHSGSVLVVKPDPVAVEAAKTAVPNIKTASEIPTPKKRGPKPKENPVNGPGITDEDIASAGKPAPEINQEELKKEVAEFVEGVDPTPTKEEMVDFTARVRVLTASGAISVDLKNFILKTGNKTDVKQLTVRDWRTALETLEAAQKEGKLKEEIAKKLKEVKNDSF